MINDSSAKTQAARAHYLASRATLAMLGANFMRPLKPTTPLIFAVSAIALLAACRTHDRRIYSTRPEKHLRVPMPNITATSGTNAATGAAGVTTPGADTVVITPGESAPSIGVPAAPPSPVTTPQ